MSVFVKICGICSRNDLEQICALEPNAIGFVFWPKAKRYVRPEQVAPWLSSIPETVKKVGVFVQPSAEEVEKVAGLCQLDAVQIHITSNDWKIDRPLFEGLETWLAPRLDEPFTPAVLNAINPAPSVLLADSFDPQSVGGTGTPSNWDSARRLVQTAGRPVLLAGGLTPDNVCEAIAAVQPWGVDVSSGVEKEPGVKDLRKVKKFIEKVRHESDPA